MEKELYSLGEALDIIEKGKIAVSIAATDNGVIIGVDADDYIMVIHPGRDPRYYHYFRKNKNAIEKRWIIINEPEFVKEAISKVRKENISLELKNDLSNFYLDDTIDILLDYDGNSTVESLKELIDETRKRLIKLQDKNVKYDDVYGEENIK